MAKVRTTLTIDDSVLRAVKVRAAHSGRGDSEVIEEALRRDLGIDFLERMWEQALSSQPTGRRAPGSALLYVGSHP
jgi:hypothetical protein